MLAAVILVWLHTTNGNVVAAQPADFGFRFEVGGCGRERLDTFDGGFTKFLGGQPDRIVTTHIALTAAQMTAISLTIESIRFFDYPSAFHGVPPDLPEVGWLHPAPTYRLEIRTAGSVHTVSWKDAYRPTTAEADRLRDLFSMVLGFIHDHPAYKRLPPAIGGCE